jgi:hypothetical protein
MKLLAGSRKRACIAVAGDRNVHPQWQPKYGRRYLCRRPPSVPASFLFFES